jgi:hypothetical protein
LSYWLLRIGYISWIVGVSSVYKWDNTNCIKNDEKEQFKFTVFRQKRENPNDNKDEVTSIYWKHGYVGRYPVILRSYKNQLNFSPTPKKSSNFATGKVLIEISLTPQTAMYRILISATPIYTLFNLIETRNASTHHNIKAVLKLSSFF